MIVNFIFCTTIPYGNVRCFTIWPYHAVGATQRKVSGIFSLSFARIVFKSHTFGHFFACKVSFGVAAMIPQEIESICIKVTRIIAVAVFHKKEWCHFFTFSFINANCIIWQLEVPGRPSHASSVTKIRIAHMFLLFFFILFLPCQLHWQLELLGRPGQMPLGFKCN